ncbi:ABC-type Fe3+-hydroxamate transport system substrate-binding protein [Paenibacillus sp. DS2015]
MIPVGTPGLTLKNYYFKDALKGVADSYEQLSKIAPTIIIPYGTLKNAHEELTYFGL